MKKWMLVILLTILFATPLLADTHVSSTCGYSDVLSAYTAASNGDTVTVPAGSCDWGASTLSVSKQITIIGAGSGESSTCNAETSTCITGTSRIFNITVGSSETYALRISGIYFATSYSRVFDITGGASGWRINGNYFYFNGATGKAVIGITANSSSHTLYGLLDGNVFKNVYLYFSGGSTAADNSWKAAPQWGTNNAVFVENNHFDHSDRSLVSVAIDSQNGGRFTVRYNIFDNVYIMAHAFQQASVRGARSYEIYNNYFRNTFSTSVSAPYYAYFRAGSAVVTRNKVAGGWSWNPGSSLGHVGLDNRRSWFDSYTDGTLGRCDGTNTLDMNIDPNPATSVKDGYRCADQPGAGTQEGTYNQNPTYALDPIYVWGNSSARICKTGTDAFKTCASNGDCANSDCIIAPTQINQVTVYNNTNNSPKHLVAGREWYDTVTGSNERQEYTPYTCPHPLAGEGTCDPDVAGTVGYSIGLAPDETPPVISNQTPTGQQACTGDDEQVEIGVTTDESATCKYDTSDVAYASMANTFSSTGGTTHTQTVTSDCSSSPLYYVRCMDEAENVNTVSAQISYQMASDEDTTPPTLSARALGTDGRTITLTASEAIVYGSGGSAGWTVATDAETEISVVYVSGSGTASIVLQTDRIVLSTETITLSYTQPSDGWEDQAGNDLATIEDAAITNGSSHSGASDGTQLWADEVYAVGGVAGDSQAPGERGVRFKSTQAGKITHIKFYKQVEDTGTHVVNVWADNGANLATQTVTGETESGLQTVELDTPVEILPDTYYIVSYFTPTGKVYRSVGYFSAEFTSSTFTVPEYGGRYAFGSSTRFPNSTQPNNLWLDFEFAPGYVVTPSLTGTGGTISGSRVGLEDEQPTVTVTLRSGHRIKSVGGTCGGSGSLSGYTYTYTPTALSEDCTVEVEVEAIPLLN